MNINKIPAKTKLLVAPLDWGLGHATRCVPLIRALLAEGFHVILAAEKAGAGILHEEFPALEILPLPGWRVNYPAAKRGFVFKMMLRIPKVLRAIKQERRFLKNTIGVHRIDVVISDNRFGLHHPGAHCIFITHQLSVQTGSRLLNAIAQKINYRFIGRFDECWVPDFAGGKNLAGALSHPEKLPRTKVRYIGSLSRFQQKETVPGHKIVAVISGPEPQRSQFEDELVKQMQELPRSCVIVRGLPGQTNLPESNPANILMLNHLPAGALNDLLSSAKIIIARSGYSTIMDLAALNRSAILFPTPGQKEQEYLALYLSKKNYFIAANAANFNLCDLLKKFEETEFTPLPNDERNLLVAAIRDLK